MDMDVAVNVKVNEEKLWKDFFLDRCRHARNALIGVYTPFVKSIALNLYEKVKPMGVEVADCIQSGMEGLLDAIERFEPETHPSAQFKTYARYRVSGVILNSVRNYSEKTEQVAWRKRLEKERIESIRQVSDGSNSSLFDATVDLILNVATTELLSHSTPTDARSGERRDWPYNAYKSSFEDEGHKVRRALAKLAGKERDVVHFHYFQDLSFTDISFILELSKARISQVHAKAVSRLKKIFFAGKKLDVAL